MDEFNKESFYAFGEPEPVTGARIFDYLGVFTDAYGDYYLPPISLLGLSQMRFANPQHGSCIVFRRNMAARSYIDGGLPMADFRRCITDYLTFGNAYIELIKNRLGQIIGLRHLPGLNMRVLAGQKGYRQLLKKGEYIDFTPDEVLQVKEYDTTQDIYGVPDWLGGMQSALLGEDATLFRRKYFKNGCHLGFIFYTNDPKMTPQQEEQIKDKLRSGKAAGNFRTMFISIPNGAEKAIQILPIGDISQKDEFTSIKNISANDVREAHRVPPVLMGIVPQGTGSLGDPEKTERVYTATEVAGLTQAFAALNEGLPANLQFKFKYDFTTGDNLA